MLHIGFSEDFDMVILSNLEILFYLGIPDFPHFPCFRGNSTLSVLDAFTISWVCVLKPSKATAGLASPPLPALSRWTWGWKSIGVCLGNGYMDIFLILWFCNISEFCFNFTENKTTVTKQREDLEGCGRILGSPHFSRPTDLQGQINL